MMQRKMIAIATALDFLGVLPDQINEPKFWFTKNIHIKTHWTPKQRNIVRCLVATRILWRIILPPMLLIFRKIKILFLSENGKWVSNHSHSRFNFLCVKYTDISPTKTITFEGLKVNAPNNPQKWLQSNYGKNFMQPPPKIQQVPLHFKFEDKLTDNPNSSSKANSIH